MPAIPQLDLVRVSFPQRGCANSTDLRYQNLVKIKQYPPACDANKVKNGILYWRGGLVLSTRCWRFPITSHFHPPRTCHVNLMFVRASSYTLYGQNTIRARGRPPIPPGLRPLDTTGAPNPTTYARHPTTSRTPSFHVHRHESAVPEWRDHAPCATQLRLTANVRPQDDLSEDTANYTRDRLMSWASSTGARAFWSRPVQVAPRTWVWLASRRRV